MEAVQWVMLAALGAAVSFPVTKMLESVWTRLRTPRQTTVVQWRARLRRHFWIAAAACVVEAICAVALMDGNMPLAAIAALAAVLFARSARRRWVRWQEAQHVA